jgi:IS30 family transposase
MRLNFKKRKDMRKDLKELTHEDFSNQIINPWCRASDFAKKAKVTTQTVFNWIRSDKLESGTFQGIIFVRTKEVEKNKCREWRKNETA